MSGLIVKMFGSMIDDVELLILAHQAALRARDWMMPLGEWRSQGFANGKRPVPFGHRPPNQGECR